MQKSFHCFAEAEPLIRQVAPLLAVMAVSAALLSGCAAPVLMRNPANGEIAQCYSNSDIVRRYHDRDTCVEEFKKLGWEVAASP